MVRHMDITTFFISSTLAILLQFSYSTSAIPTMPYKFYECASAADCQPGECCTIGMMRYSIPTCLPIGGEGAYCREHASPNNITLYYPNGASVDLENVYTLFCPCDANSNLVCQRGTCQYDNFI